MSSWAERVHRRAADFSNVVTSCGHPGSSAPTYPYRLEKVKFGVPLEEVCKNDNIPGPLLVLILKLNKESPNRRDVFRAPGHQGAMKKLIHFLQAGRLVNVDNYSVYTIASVLKKFLRKIPNGIFGRSGEEELFAIIELSNEAEQIDRLHKLIQSLPKYTQHLLVLLFGTFRVIASNAAHAGTGMTSEALGVSVAPSFFQSCVSDGKTARMEDVLKFKVATKIMKHIIDKFATHDLFGRENYEYYARVTGRILKVQDEWICSFQYPPPPRGKQAQQKYALQHSLEAEKTWLQCQCERWGLLAQEESRSTPALLTSSSSALDNSVVSLGVTPEHSFMESCARLSVSLEGPGLFALTSSPLPTRKRDLTADDDDDDIDEDDYNNDEDDEDHQYGDDDEGDNDNNHFNDHLQQPHQYGQQAENVDVDFANELEISHGSSGGGCPENIENQSYKANFRSGLMVKQQRKLKCRSKTSSNEPSRGNSGGEGGGGDVTFTDSQDDIDDEMNSVVKRRYKQNKKKTTTHNTAAQLRAQQQRRYRTSTPEVAAAAVATSSSSNNINFKTNDDYEFIGKPSTIPTTTAATTTIASTVTLKALAIDSAVAMQQKSRVCSRCKRGIRHSSSCSSSTASGGGVGVGVGSIVVDSTGMTMEELRAVNRYAESTKSLSYLPQVHERQTARMRTRSEWFLGPKDGDLLCVPPNTCSNCCLSAVNLQTAGNYLGGGSTRDMRRMELHHSANVTSIPQSQPHTTHITEAVNTSLYLYYKQRQQQHYQQQQLPLQRQSFHLSPEHMDTDESFSASYVAGVGGGNSLSHQMNLHSMQQQLSAIQQQQQQQQQTQHQRFNVRQAQEGQGIFLDTNYGRYDFDDKDILITTTTTTTNDNDIIYNNNNNNNYNNIKENHNNINNNSNSYYTLSQRQHNSMNYSSTATSSTTNTTTTTTTHLPLSLVNKSNSSLSSMSLYHMHANRNRNKSLSSIQPQCSHNMSQYFSTESILNNPNFTMVSSSETDDNDETTLNAISKLAYHSPRQQQNDMLLAHALNTSNANTTATATSTILTTTTLSSTASTYNNNNNILDRVDGSANYDTISNVDTEDVCYKNHITSPSPSHNRHSTPMIQRRRLRHQALRRQRSPSTSSSLYQSFNASLQAPMTSANLGAINRFHNSSSNSSIVGHHSTLNTLSNYDNQSTISSSGAGVSGSGGGGSGGSSSSNNNFVSIIFNVLDFLF